jgi:hypothetical protein
LGHGDSVSRDSMSRMIDAFNSEPEAYLFPLAAIAGMRDLFSLERPAAGVVADKLDGLHEAFLWGRCAHISVPVRSARAIEVAAESSSVLRRRGKVVCDGISDFFVVGWDGAGRAAADLSGLAIFSPGPCATTSAKWYERSESVQNRHLRLRMPVDDDTKTGLQCLSFIQRYRR